eukprot:1207318-Amphidinium_carterae.1
MQNLKPNVHAKVLLMPRERIDGSQTLRFKLLCFTGPLQTARQTLPVSQAAAAAAGVHVACTRDHTTQVHHPRQGLSPQRFLSATAGLYHRSNVMAKTPMQGRGEGVMLDGLHGEKVCNPSKTETLTVIVEICMLVWGYWIIIGKTNL